MNKAICVIDHAPNSYSVIGQSVSQGNQNSIPATLRRCSYSHVICASREIRPTLLANSSSEIYGLLITLVLVDRRIFNASHIRLHTVTGKTPRPPSWRLQKPP